VLAGAGGPEYSAKPRSVEDPLSTVLADDHRVVVAPTLVKVNHGAHDGKVDARGEAIDAPLSTVTAARLGHGLVAATLVQTGYGEREGQAARVPHVDKPLGTVMAGGQKHAVVTSFLARHFGGVVGKEMDAPVPTITARDHHSLAAATLVQFNHSNAPVDPRAPLPTILSNNHVAEVRAFLTVYYGGDARGGQRVDVPMRTVTTKDRLGLVTVQGNDYQIVDIGMRMLEPTELLRAQFGRFAAAYDLSAAVTKTGMVRLIGNSVCPEVAEAVVAANAPEAARTAA
jgi:DNA (cytosine-5)-methyltransferase 1